VASRRTMAKAAMVQHVYPDTAHYADGRTGVEMRNAYCLEYHRTVWGVLGNRGILFRPQRLRRIARVFGIVGRRQRTELRRQWLASVVIAGQSAAMSGYAIWGMTRVGIKTPTSVCRRRTCSCGGRSSAASRRSCKCTAKWPGSCSTRGDFGDDALGELFRAFAKLHTRLFPTSTRTRSRRRRVAAIIRPLVLMNQSDANTFGLKNTYHFGNEFLVAPMITPNSTSRQVYCPRDLDRLLDQRAAPW